MIGWSLTGAAIAGAQTYASAPMGNSICSYLGEALPQTISSLHASGDAAGMIQKIVDASGLVQNFDVAAAAIPNAAAVSSGGIRHIYYNPDFIRDLPRRTGTKWAPVSVLAHEVGHHLNGHALGRGGSRPQLEIEADAFSGFILQRLGASLADATAVIRLLGSQSRSSTHPNKAQRLAAITSGWIKACEKDPDCFVDPKDEPGSLPADDDNAAGDAGAGLMFDEPACSAPDGHCANDRQPDPRAEKAILHQQ
jgi:hypothetical protein